MRQTYSSHIMSFIFFSGLLLLLSMMLIVWLLLRDSHQESNHHDRIRRNIALYQQQLKSLDAELQEQEISQEEYDEFYAELSRQLLADVAALESSPTNSHSRRKWLFALVPMPLFALVFYASLGSYAD